MLVLNREEVEKLLDLRELIGALERAFVEYSQGRTSVPPRVGARSAAGLLGAMPGYLPGVGLEVKVVSIFPGNHARGLPSHRGFIALFGESEGEPLALMDAEYITAIRTAAGAAVSIKHLARKDATIVAILGAGALGQAHLSVLPLAGEFGEFRVASRTREHAERLAAQSPDARAAASFEEAVRDADIVCCCTDTREPIVQFEWLKNGAHVSSVGGSFGPELDSDTVLLGRLFVEWRGAATNPPPAGAHELQGVEVERLTELGEVIAGSKPGRATVEEVTVYKSTGLAIEDAAAAGVVYERALREGAGVEISV
jgi:ornithine cyclodeaminase/alanine dehydrogenase-like protein (mu-crystallin family)